jgi:hypothetical protein
MKSSDTEDGSIPGGGERTIEGRTPEEQKVGFKKIAHRVSPRFVEVHGVVGAEVRLEARSHQEEEIHRDQPGGEDDPRDA